jgi:hypothetical protein
MSEENIRKEHKMSDSTPESEELSIDAMDKVAGGITDSAFCLLSLKLIFPAIAANSSASCRTTNVRQIK